MPALKFDYEHEMAGKFDPADINNFLVEPVEGQRRAGIVFGEFHCPLVKMHFHKPSEHVIHGGRRDFEAHLVHKVPTFPESLPALDIVVAVFFHEGKNNATGTKHTLLREAVVRVPKFKMTKQGEYYFFRPDVFLPTDQKDFYCYAGSLTSAPFTEVVTWIVMKDEDSSLDTLIELEVEEGSLEHGAQASAPESAVCSAQFRDSTETHDPKETNSKETTTEKGAEMTQAVGDVRKVATASRRRLRGLGAVLAGEPQWVPPRRSTT